MASFGQPNRNRPALYKPTDFANKQKRSNLFNEPKVEEPQVVVKIQQRPQSTEKEHLSQKLSSSSEVTGTLVESKEDTMESKTDESFPQKMVGVAEKDLEKIRKLNEFMAKQQEGAKAEDCVRNDKELSVKTNEKGQERNKKDNKEIKSGPPVSRSQRQNRSPSKGKATEKDGKSSSAKQDGKGEIQSSNKSSGTRPKSKNRQPGKPVHNPKNQGKGFNGPNRHPQNVGSHFVPPNYGGRPSQVQPWLSAPVVNNPGILKKAYVPNAQQNPREMPSYSKLVNPDKSEQKRSLDFVKNFFDTDPEVLHNRKMNLERNMKPTGMNNNSATIEPSSILTQPMYNVSLHDNQQRPVSMSHNAAQLQSLMAHNSHVAAMPSSFSVYQQPSISQGAPGLTSSVGSIHHSSSPSSLHHGQSSLHHGGTGSLHNASVPQNTSTNTYHTMNQPTSMFQHQSTTGYPVDIYSQIAPSTMLSPGSNYQDSLTSSSLHSGGLGSGYSYSGYIPAGNHHSHIHHVQQHLDPATIQNIMEDQKKWQKTALSKCGPINSKQARSLIEQLIDGSYECMVCCESVKWNTQIWNCGNCFHIFHLSCIRKWARSEAASVKDESGWRCPGCQNVSTRPPNKYYCFCGKVRDPDWNPRDGITPHSCGEVCKKKRVNPSCSHVCNELCHPGPCPPCPVMVTKHCPCGKTTTKKRCGQLDVVKCEKVCLKVLKCGQHYCQRICHEGPCDICDIKRDEVCYCGKDSRIVICGTGKIIEDSKPDSLDDCTNQYSCTQPCGRLLTCGNHQCEGICHPGPCKDCFLLPGNIQFCPCGKVPVNLLSDEKRTTCMDPIPTCESFCGKKLQCGPKGSSHLCMMKCHTGACQPCQKITTVQCRCGATRKEVACKVLSSDEVFLCERKCNKKRKCGRHKCNQKCCTDREHSCNIICGKKLSCGLHKCDEVCHTGFCPTCWRAGFDELPCHCGATVLYPPIACGAKPPDCNQPCTRAHACTHAPLHTCHSEETCPPCTVLTTKKCMGGHEVWKNIPCHLVDVSCGRKCGKILPCELHKCNKACHRGACLDPPEVCNQPCPIKRKECSHPCASPCHTGLDCPNTPCKAQVTISCRCGRKSANTSCLTGNVNSEYLSFNSELLSNQLHNLQSGQSIDITSLTNLDKRPKFLECDEECSRLERNKRLAEALGIDNPESGHFQSIMYSQSLRQEAKTQYHFVQRLEKTLETLVMTAKKSSQSQIHHAFPSMNSSQRKIIHELAEAYGCKSYSQDQEPNRNTVVIATRESYVPGVKLSTLVEREILKPNPPPPMLLMSNDNIIMLGSTTPLKPILKKPTDGTSKVDYFDDDFNE